eukprot:XP_015575730.1 cation/H(+) antiporter 15 [Ricinus communis]
MSTYSGKTIYVKHGDRITAHPTVCFSYQQEKQFHSIFYYEENNPFKFISPVLMFQIIMIFVMSRLVYTALRPLKQPKFVCNVLAGIILGPSVMGRNKVYMETFFAPKEMQVFNTLVVFGVAYFIFLTAVKMDTNALLLNAKNAWSIALTAYIVPLVIVQLYSLFTEKYLVNCFEGPSSFFKIVGMNISYFPAIANLLEEHNLLTTELGQLALSTAMLSETFNNILVTLFVSTLIIVFMKSYVGAVRNFFLMFSVILFAICIVRPLILQIIRRKPDGKPIQSIFVVASVLCAFWGAVMADIFMGVFIPGVVLIGLVIPDGPPLGSILVEKSELMVTEFFLPLFYVQVGFQTDVSSIKDIQAVGVFLVKLILLTATKILGTMLASSFFDIKLKNAFMLGVILNLKGVQDLYLYGRWYTDKTLSTQCYTTAVLFSLFLTGVFCPFIQILYKPQARLINSAYVEAFAIQTMQSTPKEVELRALSCVYDEDNVKSMITLLNAFNPNKSSPMCVYVTHLVELVGRAVPLLIPYTKNKKRFMPHNSHHIIHAFRNFEANSNDSVAIQPFVAVAPIKSMHNIICNLARDKHIPLIIVPFNDSRLGKRLQGNIRIFNSTLQEIAYCTVGILVDRGLHQTKSTAHYFSVAVLFVGGPDDREALALADRMSGNPQMRITMFRIISKDEEEGGEEDDTCELEKELDELSVQEFRQTSITNAYVSCSQMVANNGLQMMDVIRSLRRKYKLVIVGKVPRRSQYEKEMLVWIEYPELGVLGDALASPDFDDSDMSVLVVKQSDVDLDESKHGSFRMSSLRCNSQAHG